MAYEYLGNNSLEYFPCNYGNSKLRFRGPKRQINGDYIATIGGSETFGKFIEHPYPALLEMATGEKVINLGCMYAGPEVFGTDRTVLGICSNARTTVIQLTGAQNMTNRFYVVHPRRNDRFLRPTRLLGSVYPDVDFTDVHFTGHLLGLLWKTSKKRFEIVRRGLQTEWLLRMQTMLSKIGGKIILLWLADHSPHHSDGEFKADTDPMFLNHEMIDQLTKSGAELLEVVASPDEITAGHERMVYTQFEEVAARQMLGPIAHQEAARQIQNCIAYE